MATLIPRVPTSNNQQYTLDSQASAGATSVTLNSSVAGIVQAPGYFVVDRIDSSGNKTATKREYKKFTGVAGAVLSGVTSVDGTDQVHAVGAIVEFVPDVKYEADWYSAFTSDHDTYGNHISLASLSLINTAVNQVRTHLFASGASLSGFPVHPAWVIPGTVSGATTSVGKPLDMPQSGTIEFVSVVLRSAISGASLILDLNKNGQSIFDAGTRPFILGSGTFVSTASINTKTFNSGDVFSVDVDAGGWFNDATVKFRAR